MIGRCLGPQARTGKRPIIYSDVTFTATSSTVPSPMIRFRLRNGVRAAEALPGSFVPLLAVHLTARVPGIDGDVDRTFNGTAEGWSRGRQAGAASPATVALLAAPAPPNQAVEDETPLETEAHRAVGARLRRAGREEAGMTVPPGDRAAVAGASAISGAMTMLATMRS